MKGRSTLPEMLESGEPILMPTVKVKIENLNKTIDAQVGEDLRNALIDNKIQIYEGLASLLNCQGKGLCGTCVVDIVEGQGLSDPCAYELFRARTYDKLRTRFMGGQKSEHPRLACMARCYQDTVIRTVPQPITD